MKDEKDLKVKNYTNGEVTIVWKPELCYHSKNCVDNLPAVFDPEKRPWINAEGASSDQIISTVRKCPSGALTYFLNETSQSMPIDQPNKSGTQKIEVAPNGPYIVEGNISLKLPNGEEVIRSKKTALCRCGASNSKPFCDGSHVKINFSGD